MKANYWYTVDFKKGLLFIHIEDKMYRYKLSENVTRFEDFFYHNGVRVDFEYWQYPDDKNSKPVVTTYNVIDRGDGIMTCTNLVTILCRSMVGNPVDFHNGTYKRQREYKELAVAVIVFVVGLLIIGHLSDIYNR